MPRFLASCSGSTIFVGALLCSFLEQNILFGEEHNSTVGGKVDFNRDVRPILSDKCFACHGPDAKHVEGELRLDLREVATKRNGEGRVAIVPGKPEASELVRRISSADADERMPPEKSHKRLSPAERRLLARWIAEGAEYKLHWAFVAPVRPEPPAVQGMGFRIHNPIDAFVGARLNTTGLCMSPEAERTMLLRRVTLDLTGLPPTLLEIDAFLSDRSDNAYEKVADRLLASPRYGERMAMWWLDGARYADSNGYEEDDERFMWRWRDWVIDAFNRNQPFDQFTIEQLAGDLLPHSTLSQRIATGFNRNHRINGEGGIIPEEWRIEGVIDRVETTSAVWMALTMGCARCHDHKYDPLTQREFYQFFAFFNNVPESGQAPKAGNTRPFITAPGPEEERKLAKLESATLAAESAKRDEEARLPELQARWERDLGTPLLAQARSWTLLAPQATAAGGATFTPQPDGSYLVGGPTPATDVYTLVTTLTEATSVSAIRLDVLPDPSHAAKSFGRVGNGNIVLGEVEAEVTDSAQPQAGPRRIKFAEAVADYSQPNWAIAAAIDGNPETGWALDGHDPDKRYERHAAFFPTSPITLPQGGVLTVRVRQEVTDNRVMGRFRLAISSAQGIRSAPAGLLPPQVVESLSTAPQQRTPAQKQAIAEYFRLTAGEPVLAPVKAAVDKARQAKNDYESLLTVMVMEEMPQPRDCFVLVRGQYDKHGEKVTARLPAALPPLPAGQPPNRLGLARWLVDPAHPLTARVQVNRYWELLFGMGIVKSSENFGLQSQYPSHPELLDWLATEYIRLRWDTKAILKTIVLSATYRQSSQATPQAVERDPENRLLARGPRFRLPAEMVRDNALAISGLLVHKIGGRSVRPYQPRGIWDELAVHGNLRNYQHDQGEGLYRRSMYTIWKRTTAPPNLIMFDMPGRELCAVKRCRTNTPLQALSLLNEETYVEAARVLAQQMLHAGGSTPEQRIALAFRRATARWPDAHERQTLAAGLQRNLARFRAHPETAKQLIAIGESPADSQFDPTELAAYTLTANVILNLDETITKE